MIIITLKRAVFSSSRVAYDEFGATWFAKYESQVMLCRHKGKKSLDEWACEICGLGRSLLWGGDCLPWAEQLFSRDTWKDVVFWELFRSAMVALSR